MKKKRFPCPGDTPGSRTHPSRKAAVRPGPDEQRPASLQEALSTHCRKTCQDSARIVLQSSAPSPASLRTWQEPVSSRLFSLACPAWFRLVQPVRSSLVSPPKTPPRHRHPARNCPSSRKKPCIDQYIVIYGYPYIKINKYSFVSASSPCHLACQPCVMAPECLPKGSPLAPWRSNASDSQVITNNPSPVRIPATGFAQHVQRPTHASGPCRWRSLTAATWQSALWPAWAA